MASMNGCHPTAQEGPVCTKNGHSSSITKNGYSDSTKNGHSEEGSNGALSDTKKRCLQSGHGKNGVTNGLTLDGHGAQRNGSSSDDDTGLDNEASMERGYRFLCDAVPVMVKKALQDGADVRSRVVEFKHPEELRTLLDLSLPTGPTDNASLHELVTQIVQYSVKTGHPRFFNQLFGGIDPFGLTGAWLTEALNTSSYTFEVAPVFTLMEKEVMQTMLRLIGFEDGDGIFCPGGSMSNMYAMNLARYKMFPDVKRTGLAGMPPLCVMTSEKAHYSVVKGAAFMGLGTDGVVKVKTDPQGRLDPRALDQALHLAKSQGKVPIMVVATAGSTVLGSYDPLPEVTQVCRQHGGLWLHVDGAWGGAVLLSPSLRHKMAGIESADSMSWNPHKMMGAPLQCSGFFTRHKGLLQHCHSASATYLFQQDKFYDVSFDTGDKSVQCGRKVDCLKLWMLWKAHGTHHLTQRIEHLFQCSQYLVKKLKTTEGFRLVLEEPECTNVCFWFIPPSLRGQPETAQWRDKLAKVAPTVKQRMVEAGTLLVGYQPLDSMVNFFRMVLINYAVTFKDMDFVVSEIARLGHDL